MSSIPEGALLQKHKNGVSYVYFPSYYYDKLATTHNKEKQKRLYIGKCVDGVFVPNRLYLSNPQISRQDVGKIVSAPIDLSHVTSRSVGTTTLLKGLADKVHLTKDLEAVYGKETSDQLLSLALFMCVDSESALSLYPTWQQRFWVPSEAAMTSQFTSRLLAKIGRDESALEAFFKARVKHVRANEYLSYDSTKIASESEQIHDVRWAPSKSGQFQREISLALLCGQKSRIPVMFRVLPGNVPDVKTVRDFLCRWDEIGIVKEATAVLDRGYNSIGNLLYLCRNQVKFVVAQKTSLKLVKDSIEADMPKFWMSKHYLGEYNLFGVTRETALVDEDGTQHSLWIHAFRSDMNTSVSMQALEHKLTAYEDAWKAGTASKAATIRNLFKPSDAMPGDGSKLVRDYDAIDAEIRYKGFFAFASNSVKTPTEALAIYRGRDCVEKTFANLQTGLDFTSTGVHGEDTLRGKLLVCMLALTMIGALSYEMEREKEIDGDKCPRLYKDYTLKGLMNELMNIRLISHPNMPDRLSEATAKQLLIYDRVGIARPRV